MDVDGDVTEEDEDESNGAAKVPPAPANQQIMPTAEDLRAARLRFFGGGAGGGAP